MRVFLLNWLPLETDTAWYFCIFQRGLCRQRQQTEGVSVLVLRFNQPVLKMMKLLQLRVSSMAPNWLRPVVFKILLFSAVLMTTQMTVYYRILALLYWLSVQENICVRAVLRPRQTRLLVGRISILFWAITWRWSIIACQVNIFRNIFLFFKEHPVSGEMNGTTSVIF